jgi:hypothetical protein
MRMLTTDPGCVRAIARANARTSFTAMLPARHYAGFRGHGRRTLGGGDLPARDSTQSIPEQTNGQECENRLDDRAPPFGMTISAGDRRTTIDHPAPNNDRALGWSNQEKDYEDQASCRG